MTLSELGHRGPRWDRSPRSCGDHPVELSADRNTSATAGDVRACRWWSVDLSGVETFFGPLLGGQPSQPWLVLPALGTVIAVALVVWLVLRRRGEPAPVAVANTEPLRTLPEYRSAVRRHRWMVAGGVALARFSRWPRSSARPAPSSGSRSWTRRTTATSSCASTSPAR